MKMLMATPFPPYRDGIAAYAVQELRALRAAGDEVDVVSPLPSAAPFHLPLGGAPGMAMLARKAVDYHRIVIQFSPEMMFGRCHGPAERVSVWLAIAGLCRVAEVDIRLHEIEYGPLERNRAERLAATAALRAATRVTVHTEAEREALIDLVGPLRPLRLVDHGRNFQPATVTGPERARAALGLPDHPFIFLAIGFLQEHKGFDRAIEAMGRMMAGTMQRGAAGPGGRPDTDRRPHLYVVGSARVDHPEITSHVDRLRRLCDLTPDASLREGYVSDEQFDLWLRAADGLILPYREIWSSGVLERARLFDLPVIASDLPQLRDQVTAGTRLFSDVDELTTAMSELVAERGRPIDLDAGAGSQAGGGAAADDPPADGPTGSEDRRRSWLVDDAAPDRGAVQAQIADRARRTRVDEARTASTALDRPVDRLLAIGPLHRPEARSARPGVSGVKRLVQRLIDWRIEPVAARVEELQRATVSAVAELERRSTEPAADRPGATRSDPTGEDRPGADLTGTAATGADLTGTGGVTGRDAAMAAATPPETAATNATNGQET